MLFLILLMGMMLISSVFVIRTVYRKTGEGLLTACGLVFATILLLTPVAMELATLAAIDRGEPVAMDGGFLPLWHLGGGGALTLLVCGYRLFRLGQQQAPSILETGANVYGVLFGLYMAFVVIDQRAFFSPPAEDAGMVNWSFFQETAHITDIQCQSDMLVVKGADSPVAIYRCPDEGTLVFGRYTGTPIVLWPNYTEGHSRQLATTMQKLYSEAKK